MAMRRAPIEQGKNQTQKAEVIDLSGATTGSDLFVRAVIVIVVIFGLFKAISSFASQPDPTQSAPGACATLEAFSGEVQILDSSRTHFVTTTIHAPVACGSWVKVGRGWA